jgi:hypothetical protein
MKKQYDFSKGKRGAVIKVPRGKSRITSGWMAMSWNGSASRWMAAESGSYQNLINRALRAHVERSEEPLGAIRRRVVREELGRASYQVTGPILVL